jgi:hypothetical protein
VKWNISSRRSHRRPCGLIFSAALFRGSSRTCFTVLFSLSLSPFCLTLSLSLSRCLSLSCSPDGNLLYQVLFLDSLLSDKNTYDDDYYHFSIGILAAIGLGSATLFWLGGVLSVLALRRLSALALQLHGFALSAAAFFLVAVCKAILPKSMWPTTIFCYVCTYLFMGMGPAPTTFLLPSLLFPAGSGIRSTANGLAAGCGKLGAIAAVVTVGYAGFDITTLMAFFCAVGLCGMAASLFTIRSHMKADASHYYLYPTASDSSSGMAKDRSQEGREGGVPRSEYVSIPGGGGNGRPNSSGHNRNRNRTTSSNSSHSSHSNANLAEKEPEVINSATNRDHWAEDLSANFFESSSVFRYKPNETRTNPLERLQGFQYSSMFIRDDEAKNEADEDNEFKASENDCLIAP